MHGDLTYSCRITAEEHDSTGTGYTGKLSDMWVNGRQNYAYSFRNVFIKGENATTGTVTAVGHCDSTGKTFPSLVVDSIGKAGQSGRLGSGPAVRLGNGTRLVYTGGGEETDRTLYLKNGGASGTGVIEHDGTGLFEWSGVVSQECETATLALAGASSAGAVFSGVIGEFPKGSFANPVLNLEKRESCTWTLTASNTYSGSTDVKAGTLAIGPDGSIARTSGVTLSGGSLVYLPSETPATERIASLELSASSTITLGRNRSLEMAAMPTRTGSETLDIAAADLDSKFVVAGATPGAAPEWLTINGVAAAFDSNGVLCRTGLTRWQGADGSWSAAENWSAGVPSADKAAYVGGGDVAIDAPGATASNLFVSGSSSHITIQQGASFEMTHATAVPSEVADADARGFETFVVRDGARITVSGGALAFTNATGLASVKSDFASATSCIDVINGGVLSYSPSGDRGRMTIGAGGELAVTDSAVTNLVGTYGGIIADGGRIVFGGTSALAVGSAASESTIWAFGTGETRFEDSSKFG